MAALANRVSKNSLAQAQIFSPYNQLHIDLFSDIYNLDLLHQCSLGRPNFYIQNLKDCNGVYDCPDRSGEMFCHKRKFSASKEPLWSAPQVSKFEECALGGKDFPLEAGVKIEGVCKSKSFVDSIAKAHPILTPHTIPNFI